MLSRIVTYVLLFLAGAVIGGVGTIAHQSTLHAGIDWPWGLVASLVAYTSMLAGLRLLASSRIPALIAALGTILVVLLFAQKSAGGSVLIPYDLLGLIWQGATIVIAAIVLAWPDLGARRHRTAVSETA
jgi:hypothetical protein